MIHQLVIIDKSYHVNEDVVSIINNTISPIILKNLHFFNFCLLSQSHKYFFTPEDTSFRKAIMTKKEDPFVYSGVIISCIKVDDKGNGIVEFDDLSPAGTKGRFLKDVTEIKAGSKKFKATEIDYSEAKRIINSNGEIGTDTTPLFCVHGFNVKPSSNLENFLDVREKFKNEKIGGDLYYPVPILWPCSDGNAIFNYDKDQEGFSQEAGALFKTLADRIPDDTFPRKSLLMHSMGNHVVFNGACGAASAPQAQFENIFMVAAVSMTKHYFSWTNNLFFILK